MPLKNRPIHEIRHFHGPLKMIMAKAKVWLKEKHHTLNVRAMTLESHKAVAETHFLLSLYLNHEELFQIQSDLLFCEEPIGDAGNETNLALESVRRHGARVPFAASALDFEKGTLVTVMLMEIGSTAADHMLIQSLKKGHGD